VGIQTNRAQGCLLDIKVDALVKRRGPWLEEKGTYPGVGTKDSIYVGGLKGDGSG